MWLGRLLLMSLMMMMQLQDPTMSLLTVLLYGCAIHMYSTAQKYIHRYCTYTHDK